MNMPYDLGKTGRAASMFLALFSATEAVFILYCFYLFRFYNDLETGNMNQGEMDAAATRVDAIGTPIIALFLLATIGCYIVCGMWMYRAAANAQAVTPDDDRITPGWTVGWLFIPFANLVMPYRAIRQAWNGLHANVGLNDPMPGYALGWWLLWLLGNAIATAATRMNLDAASIDAFRTSTQFDIASSAVSIVSALLFRHLIQEMTRVSAGASHHNSSIKE